jgi:peroxin-19
MPGSQDSEGDLDYILDSALADFDNDTVSRDSGRLRGLSGDVGTAGGTRDSSHVRSQLEAGAGERERVGDVSGEGAQAFENAASALNALELDGVGGDGEEVEDPDGEDMKLVEQFLKSLSTEFEKMGLPDEGDAATAVPNRKRSSDASHVRPDAGDAGASVNGTAEEDIDRLTRELESILARGGRLSAGGGLSATQQCGSSGARALGSEVPAGESNDFENIIQSVVGELLSKDILRSPMEQMRDSYQKWLPTNQESLSKGDLARYRKQADIVSSICSEYEKEDCNTGNVMNLLQKMQETGAPPPEVMSHLGTEEGPGSEKGDSALADLEKLGKCPVQ